MSERRVAKVIIAARVLAIIAATAIGTDGRTGLLGILQFDSTLAFVIADEAIPIGTVLARTARVDACHEPPSPHRATTVGIVVVLPR